ncbi:MAG: DNA gyrase modulator, partial [Candidatus Zixiibacteriota bacterium]
MENEKLAEMALEQCRSQGVDYADVRVERIEDENISISNGTVEPLEQTISRGIGIRVIKNGAWGFTATDDLSEQSIREKAVMAAAIAEASSIVNKTPVALAPTDAAHEQYATPYEIDPFSISVDDKIAFLMDVDKAMAEAGGELLNTRNCFASFRRRHKYFCSTEGAAISQYLIQTGAGLAAGVTKGHRESYERSYPTSSGQFESKGFELLEELKMKEALPQLVEEVKMLLQAED